MTLTDQIKLLDRKIKQKEAQYGLDRKAAKISALSFSKLDKYEYLTGEDLGLKPNTVEREKFEYSPLGNIFNKGLDKDEVKKRTFEETRKTLKNGNNNDRNKKTNDKSNLSSARSESSFYSTLLSSARSESSKKALISDDKLERSIYFPHVANMKGINILEPENETKTSFEYLKNNREEFFLGYPDIFDSDFKEFYNYIASEEENIDYKLLLRQILISSKNIFSFLHKYGDLYNFWIGVLNHKSSDEVKLQQVKFLKDLINGFGVYKTIKKQKNELNYKAENLCLMLLGNPNKTVNNIFLNTPKDNHNLLTAAIIV